MYTANFRIAFCLLFLAWSTSVFGQNKKEQIEILTKQSDSLKYVIQTKNEEILRLSNELEINQKLLTKRDEEITNLKRQSNTLQTEKENLKIKLDSVQNLLVHSQQVNSPFNSKKQILTRLIGEYKLDNILGFTGANTIFETIKDHNGEWTSNTSSLEMGVRYADQIDLTKTDRHLLDNLYIQVDSNLTVSFKIGSKVVFATKFQEHQTEYLVTKLPDSELNEELQKLSPVIVFQDDYLVLYAKNNVDLENLFKVNFDHISQDVVTLKYNLFTATFELKIFTNDCCDNNTLYFKNEYSH